MPSTKKQGKHLLNEIEESANQLLLLTSDLALLAEITDMARHTLAATATLRISLTGLKKNEFGATLARSPALAILEELADSDAISALEQQLFAVQADQENNAIGEFLQQLLAKIEKRYARVMEAIQQLTALPENDDHA